MDKMIEPILTILPKPMANALRTVCRNLPAVEEIRLRRDGHLSLTVMGRSLRTDVFCSADTLERVFLALCGGSLYAHADTLSEGYIRFGACRIGVCGRTVSENGSIRTVTDVSSLNIRIPHYVYGESNELIDYIKHRQYHASLLLFSPPAMGKTTLLRDLALRLGKEKRVSLIDSRGELYDRETMSDTFIDCLSGCPKDKGFAIALRTLSPEFILCDEIGSPEDAASLTEAKRCGVCVIATCHADSMSSLLQRPLFSSLKEAEVFDAFVKLERRNGCFSYTLSEADGSAIQKKRCL